MTLRVLRPASSIEILGAPASLGVQYAGGGAAAADWWDPDSEGLCVWAAYQPKGAANYEASLTDLSGNGNDAYGANAPTWDAVNGWKFTLVQYLCTDFVPADDQSQSILVQFTNGQVGAIGWIVGSEMFDTGNVGLINYDASDPPIGQHRWHNCGNYRRHSPGMTAGNLAFAGTCGYVDGVLEDSTIPAGGTGAYTLWIGTKHRGTGPYQGWAGYIQSLAIYDCTLTGPQVAAVAAAMAAL